MPNKRSVNVFFVFSVLLLGFVVVEVLVLEMEMVACVSEDGGGANWTDSLAPCLLGSDSWNASMLLLRGLFGAVERLPRKPDMIKC